MDQIRNLVLVIARSLVDEPDQVKVNVIGDENIIVFELSVAKKDVGKIIGKQGRNVDAVRVILAAAAARIHRICRLEIIE